MDSQTTSTTETSQPEASPVTRSVASLGAYQRKHDRRQRQELCRYVALGIALARGLESADPAMFGDKGMCGMLDAVQEFKRDASQKHLLRHALDWFWNTLGVESRRGETLDGAIMRTVAEATECDRLALLGHRMQAAALRGDAAAAKRVVEEIQCTQKGEK